MKTGRPTLYNAGFVKEVQEYIRENQDVWTEFHKTRGDKSDSYERVLQVKLPSRDGFAKRIGVTRQTVDNWAEAHPEFFDALMLIDAEQKERLLNEGLAGNYNPVIAKLVLSSNHGMKESSNTDITTKGEKIGTVDTIIAQIDAARKNRE